MKKYSQNKKKVFFTSIFPHLIIIALIIFSFIILKNNAIKKAIITGTATYILIFLRFFKLILSDFKRTVEIDENKLICKSFIVGGLTVADGEIPYTLMKNIKFKRSILIPGMKGLFIEIEGNPKTPLFLTNTYHNYNELWDSVCQKIYSKNHDAEIDPKIYHHLKK